LLLLVTGGYGCGKSAFAAERAISLGREAIRFSCASLPGGPLPDLVNGPGENRFAWMEKTADAGLAAAIDKVNLASNFFRAENRVLVVDSLSGWLRAEALREETFAERADALIQSVLDYEGRIIVVTEEASAGLLSDPREAAYIRTLAKANRMLAEASLAIYRMTLGLAVPIKNRPANERKDYL
jgi:adenosylcobinamide kinase/adenosylcobinamide-phosphate guanylyltransferase